MFIKENVLVFRKHALTYLVVKGINICNPISNCLEKSIYRESMCDTMLMFEESGWRVCVFLCYFYNFSVSDIISKQEAKNIYLYMYICCICLEVFFKTIKYSYICLGGWVDETGILGWKGDFYFLLGTLVFRLNSPEIINVCCCF